ncbi:MAG: hypothetical protein ABWZ41_10230 [Burkholderiales bacterium]
MRRPRSIAKLAAVIVLALSGFALAGVMASSGLATDPTTSGTDTGTTSTGTTSTGTTDTGTTSTGTTETQPPGGGGCTPGYWKNHTEDWVGYDPDDTVGSVFANAGSLGSMTLLQALKNGGGDTLDDAKRLLIHHAVAALLNSTHPDVDYAFTTAQVIAWTSDMLTSTDRDAILGLKNLFDAENNRGCTVR